MASKPRRDEMVQAQQSIPALPAVPYHCQGIPADGPWYDFAQLLIEELERQKALNGNSHGWALDYSEFAAYARLVLLHDHLATALGEYAQAPDPWHPDGHFPPGAVEYLSGRITDGLIFDRDAPNPAFPGTTWHSGFPGWLHTAPTPPQVDPVAIGRATDLLQRVRGALDIN